MSEYTRKSLADHFDSYDADIAKLQDGKRDMMQDYRAQLENKGWGKVQIKAEVEGFKVALRRRRAIAKKGEEEVDQFDAVADEIFVEITSTVRAPRATREKIEEFRPVDRSDGGADITMRHSAIATDLPAHDADGVIIEDQESDDDAFAAVTVTDQLADAMGVEPSPSEPNVSLHVGDECMEQPEDGLSASGDLSEIDHSSARSSRQADTAGAVVPPSAPAPLSTRHQTLTGDGGHLSKPSSDAGAGARAASAGSIVNAKSEQAATISEADVPDFLKRKDGCLDQAGCKVKTYSILCARCAAERVRARAA